MRCVIRTDEKETTPVRSGVSKSVSDPVYLSSTKHEQTDVQSSPSPAASALQVSTPNESDIRKSPSADRKKKSTFSKLLHSSKAKTP